MFGLSREKKILHYSSLSYSRAPKQYVSAHTCHYGERKNPYDLFVRLHRRRRGVTEKQIRAHVLYYIITTITIIDNTWNIYTRVYGISTLYVVFETTSMYAKTYVLLRVGRVVWVVGRNPTTFPHRSFIIIIILFFLFLDSTSEDIFRVIYEPPFTPSTKYTLSKIK